MILYGLCFQFDDHGICVLQFRLWAIYGGGL